MTSGPRNTNQKNFLIRKTDIHQGGNKRSEHGQIRNSDKVIATRPGHINASTVTTSTPAHNAVFRPETEKAYGQTGTFKSALTNTPRPKLNNHVLPPIGGNLPRNAPGETPFNTPISSPTMTPRNQSPTSRSDDRRSSIMSGYSAHNSVNSSLSEIPKPGNMSSINFSIKDTDDHQRAQKLAGNFNHMQTAAKEDNKRLGTIFSKTIKNADVKAIRNTPFIGSIAAPIRQYQKDKDAKQAATMKKYSPDHLESAVNRGLEKHYAKQMDRDKRAAKLAAVAKVGDIFTAGLVSKPINKTNKLFDQLSDKYDNFKNRTTNKEQLRQINNIASHNKPQTTTSDTRSLIANYSKNNPGKAKDMLRVMKKIEPVKKN